MKSTISGFNQEYALTLKKQVPADKTGKTKTIQIDCTDLVVLRWLVDFYPSMKKMYVDGKEYVWLTHKKLMEDIPLLDISQKACVERMKKLVEFGILDYKFLKQGGTFSLYAFGPNYINLVRSTDYGVCGQPATGYPVNHPGGTRSNDYGVPGQTGNKDNSIKDTSVIDNIKSIVAYLNQKAGTKYKPTSKTTQEHIHARLVEGYTVDDFKAVIDKKCAQWKNDPKMAEYLRPSTLFGTKFEGYLNAPASVQGKAPATPPPAVGPNGIKTDQSQNGRDGLF